MINEKKLKNNNNTVIPPKLFQQGSAADVTGRSIPAVAAGEPPLSVIIALYCPRRPPRRGARIAVYFGNILHKSYKTDILGGCSEFKSR